MSYTRKTWENRNTEFKNRRLLTDVDTGEQFAFDVERIEGAIYTDGDPFNAANMNNMEQRISDGLGDAEQYTDSQVSSLRSTVNSLDAQNVKITGAQTKAGILTFTSLPTTTAGNPTSDNQFTRKAYVDSQSTSAVNTAKSYKKTATITNSGWSSASGYFYKTTGQTLPSGYDGDSIDLYIPPASLVNLTQSQFICAYNSGGTIFIACGAVPNGTISITLAFKLTRTA